MPLTKPALIVTSLRLMPGDVVADFGCGDGHYIREIEGKISSSGKLYAIDIQKPLLDSIVSKNKENGFSNIIPIWTDLEESARTSITAGTVDAVILANVLFMLKGTGPIIREANRVLKKGGIMLIVDWHKELAPYIPPAEKIRTREEIVTACRLAGFNVTGTPPAGSHQYAIMCEKQK
jgi:ubiquinone/menaquinone biosynthesis C-methylase UbiE